MPQPRAPDEVSSVVPAMRARRVDSRPQRPVRTVMSHYRKPVSPNTPVPLNPRLDPDQVRADERGVTAGVSRSADEAHESSGIKSNHPKAGDRRSQVKDSQGPKVQPLPRGRHGSCHSQKCHSRENACCDARGTHFPGSSISSDRIFARSSFCVPPFRLDT
jgi:hypothetical protein